MDTQSDTVEFDPNATVAQTKPKNKTETPAPVVRSNAKPSIPPPTPFGARLRKVPVAAAPAPTAKPATEAKPAPAKVASALSSAAPISSGIDDADLEPELGESTQVEAGPSDEDVGDSTDANIATPIPDDPDTGVMTSSPKLPAAPAPRAPVLPGLADGMDAAAEGAHHSISPFDATDSVGDVLTKTIAEDNVEAAVDHVLGAAMSETPANADAMPDVYTRTVADAQAVLTPPPAASASVAPVSVAPVSVAPAAVAAPQAAGLPGLPTPKTPAPAMPSVMIPRPPAASVVPHTPIPAPVASPAPQARGLSPQAMTGADPSMASMPGDYALPQVNHATPGGFLQPPGMQPPGMQPPPGMQGMQPPHGMHAPSGMHSPPQGMQGLQPPQGMQSPPVAHTPAPPVYSPPPMVHTPPPPMNIGPPPDATDHSYPGAALDALVDEQGPTGPANGTRAESANAVWRQAHPSAQRWAAKRNSGAPRSPRAGVVALGLLLAGVGVYLLALFLPSKAPLTAAEHALMAQQAGVDEGAWRFSEELITAANLNAALFVLLGLVIVLRGALHRQSPGQARRKKMDKTSVMLLFCFALFAITFLALVLSASVG